MARYLGPKAKLSRREGTDLFLKSARRSIGDKASSTPSPASTAAPRARARPTTASSCARSRRSSACTACSSASSAATSPKPSAARATPARTCCSCSSRAWTTSCYRMGFGSTRAEARQLVLAQGDHGQRRGRQHRRRTWSRPATWSPCARRRRSRLRVAEALQAGRASRHAELGRRSTPTRLEGIFKKVPDRDEFGADIKEALIVELYSR